MAKTQSKRQLIDKANSTTLLSVMLASIVISASLVGIKSLWDLRSFQDRVISEKSKVSDQLESNIDAAKQLQSAFGNFEQTDINSQIVLDALPPKYDFPALASSIDRISQRGKYKLESFVGEDLQIDALENSADPFPEEIPFSVTINGSYQEVQDFVDQIEKSIRPFKVTNLVLNGTTKEMSATFEIATFYQPSRNLELGTRTIR